jgi:hypothetical protein
MTGALLRQVVHELFEVLPKSTNDELCFLCPQPGCSDKSGHRSVNVNSGKTYCFICNIGGDFVKWARRLGHEIDDTKIPTKELDQIDISVDRIRTDDMPIVADIALPKGFRLCSAHPRSVYTELIAEMAERKGLAIDDLLDVNVGFTKDSPRWEPYAIFPSYEYGRVVYYQGRTYVDGEGGTKKFPSRAEVPYGMKYWVYGIDEAREAKIVVVVESILNVLSLRKEFRKRRMKDFEAVCVFRHGLSAYQSKKIRQLPSVKEAVLLFDHDATRRTWEKVPSMLNHIKLSVAPMPAGPGGDKNDPNDDPEGALWAIENRSSASFSHQLDNALDGLALTLMSRSKGHEADQAAVREPHRRPNH